MNSTTYWASKPIEEIAKEIEAKYDEYKQWLQTSGYGNRIKTSYNRFYGFDNQGTLNITRDNNEIAQINVNHFKSLLKRLHILCTESKIAWQPRAKTTDVKSSIEADLSRGITEYYADEKKMNSVLSEAVLTSLVCFESWIHCPWSRTEGYELTVDNGNIIRTGDQTFKAYTPYDVARSVSDESEWFVIRTKVNKYNEAALHPEFAQEILSDSLQYNPDDLYTLNNQSEDDYCSKYVLYHKRTPALPQGRKTEIIAGQVLVDGPLSYQNPPVFQLKAGTILSTTMCDSPAIDLLPIQEALNALYSGTITNNLNNCVQLLWSADPNLTTRKLSDGQVLVTSAAPPQALNLTGSAGENFKMVDLLKQEQQIISGINDIARGMGNPNVKTSGGQALFLAQALQFISDLQKNYAQLASDVATCLVNNIQQFASEELTAYITGSSKKGMIRKFKSQDIINIERIGADLGNPLLQSLAGRKELISEMLQMGVITDPKVVVSFLANGNMDQALDTDSVTSDSNLIQDENEQLKKGINPPVLLTDMHVQHIQKHNKLMSSFEARQDPMLVQVVLQHIQDHIDTMRNVPADLAAVLSGQPLPPVNPPSQQNQPNPTVDGARMPSLPRGTPEQVADNYQEQLNNMPQEQPE